MTGRPKHVGVAEQGRDLTKPVHFYAPANAPLTSCGHAFKLLRGDALGWTTCGRLIRVSDQLGAVECKVCLKSLRAE